MDKPSRTVLPPRVLLVMPDQWHRALLRAELRELGYDAVGAPDLSGSLAYPAIEPERGPVSLVLVDQQALAGAHEMLLARLLERHGHPPSMLLAPAGLPHIAGDWALVLHRPLSIADIVRGVRAVLPLDPGSRQPID